MKLLHIDSSIQGTASASRIISAAVVAELRAREPDLDITYRDVSSDPIAHLTLDAFGGAEATAIMDEFLASDIVVIGAGMYNFTIPSQLKAWIDRILVAGKTFAYGPNGAEGLAGGKRVIIALARGGMYGEGSPAAAIEHAETYLRGVFAFIGISSPEFIVTEGLALGADVREASVDAGLERVKLIGADVLA
jgi:FMN-dependent NADH-azoreductase